MIIQNHYGYHFNSNRRVVVDFCTVMVIIIIIMYAAKGFYNLYFFTILTASVPPYEAAGTDNAFDYSFIMNSKIKCRQNI